MRILLLGFQTAPRQISSFGFVTSSHMTCTGLNLCQHKLRFSRINMVFFDRQTGLQEPWLMKLRWICQNLTMDHRCYSWSRMKHCNPAPVMESDRSWCSGGKTTKTRCCANNFASIFGTQGSMCAMSCLFDGALGILQDPGSTRLAQSCHSVIKMYHWVFMNVAFCDITMFFIRYGSTPTVYGTHSVEFMGSGQGQRSCWKSL